jgi:hypothetical protein
VTKESINLILEKKDEKTGLGRLAGRFTSYLGSTASTDVFRRIKDFISISISSKGDDYSDDPFSQSLYSQYVSPAAIIGAGAKGDPKKLQRAYSLIFRAMKSVDIIIESYNESIAKVIRASIKNKNKDLRADDLSWSPGESIGNIGSKFISKLLNDMREYKQIPDPDEFAGEIVPEAFLTIIQGMMTIISLNYQYIIQSDELIKMSRDAVMKVFLGIVKYNGKVYPVSGKISSRKRNRYTKDINFTSLIKKINSAEPKDYLTKLVAFYNTVTDDAAKFKEAAREEGLSIEDENNQSGEENQSSEPVSARRGGRRREDTVGMNFDKLESKIIERTMLKLKKLANGQKIFLEMTKEEINEASVTANIAGYSLPLGVSNQEDPDQEMDDTIEKGGWSRVHMDSLNANNEDTKKKMDNFVNSFMQRK